MLPKENATLYDIALSFVPGVGVKTARLLLSKFGSAANIFSASQDQLAATPGIGDVRAAAFKDTNALELAKKEIAFTEKNNIELIHLNSPKYPKRLRHCEDAPMLMYYKGTADLNAAKTIAVIGTRKNTDYGQRLTEQLIEALKHQDDLLVISGLASGIDAIAHKACLKNGLPTLGVLGHGLDIIYPPTNKSLSAAMVEQGGLLTEFPSQTKPDRQNFPVRNRIVAGMSDVTIVVESEVKGGAMITAYMALSYNRDVAAFPGRVFDLKSQGPNHLIKKNMAVAISNAEDLLEVMNWQTKTTTKTVQSKMFLDLSDEEKIIVSALQQKEKLHADELLLASSFKLSQLATVLLQLEMQGLIKTLPGKYYRLN